MTCNIGGSAIINSNNVEGLLHWEMSRPCMFGIFLPLLLVCTNGNWLTDRMKNAAIAAMGFDVSDSCGFTREDALACFIKYVDTNKDGEISAVEFELAKQKFMPWQMRKALNIAKRFNFDFTIKDVLAGCDANKDGHLTIKDFADSEDKCLPGKQDLCEVQTVCLIAKEQEDKYFF